MKMFSAPRICVGGSKHNSHGFLYFNPPILFHVCLYYTALLVPCSLVITCHERTDLLALLLYHPQTLFVVGILFSCCPCVCVRPCLRPSVTFCFFNILKSHFWIFINPCKHVHICETNTLDKKVRARGQFY